MTKIGTIRNEISRICPDYQEAVSAHFGIVDFPIREGKFGWEQPRFDIDVLLKELPKVPGNLVLDDFKLVINTLYVLHK